MQGKSLDPLIDTVRDLMAQTGSMPPERVVAEQLNVKRHTLRRALESLRAMGELEPARAGRRAAADPRLTSDLANGTNPVEIIEIRMVLEPALARLAALRASPLEIKRIERAATTPPDAAPGTADLAFHRAIAAGSRNNLAAELYSLLRHVATDTRLRLGGSEAGKRRPDRLIERDAEHAAIARAIMARNPDAAERAMRDHLGAVQAQILGRLGTA